MRVQIKKWGNSASARIPASTMAAAALHVAQEVDLREEEGRIVIDPVMRSYGLDELLAKMTPDTFAEAIEFGGPIGSESW